MLTRAKSTKHNGENIGDFNIKGAKDTWPYFTEGFAAVVKPPEAAAFTSQLLYNLCNHKAPVAF
jgi:hypothetical protein